MRQETTTINTIFNCIQFVDEYEKRFNKDNENILNADNEDDNQFF